MLSHKLTVKGFIGQEIHNQPVISLTIDAVMMMEDISEIVMFLRHKFNEDGEPLSFQITMEDIDL